MRVRTHPNVVIEELDDELCLYRPDSDDVVVLNRTAAAVFRQFQRQTEVAAVVEAVSAQYGIQPEDVASDVANTVDELVTRGFLDVLELDVLELDVVEPAVVELDAASRASRFTGT